MRTTSSQLISVVVGIYLAGCSSSGNVGPGPGGSEAVGGSSQIGGTSGAGSPSTGGLASQNGGAATGGSAAAAGGNNPGTGGTTSVGTSVGTGGMLVTGGTNTVGGAVGTGGAPPTGGSKAAGGGTPATGGKAPTGGVPATGGSKATGGMTTIGGSKSTGGTASAAGSKATGGTAATGGVASTVPTKKFYGNITTGNSIDSGGMKFSKYWDQITPENAGKWGSVQGNPSGAFNWGTLDSIYAYTNTNGIAFKQHTFVWGSQQPSGTPTQAQVETWIKTFCGRYPNTKVIDVVNEPPPHTTPNYTANLGAGETGTYGWITKAFKLAKQYCGSAVLVLNDYNNAEYTDQRNHFVDIVKQVTSAGGPIDAVGCQGHDFADISTSTVQTNLAYLNSQTGLPIYVTEYDVSRSDDTQQLNIYKDQFPFFISTSYIHGVTIWGWIYGSTWSQAPDSGLVRGTSPRSAMTWLMGQLGRPVPPN